MKDTTELLHEAIENGLRELQDVDKYPEGSDIRGAKCGERVQFTGRLTE